MMVMRAWCERFDIPEGDALFTWNGRAVAAQDTAMSLDEHLNLHSEFALRAEPRCSE